MYSDEQKKKDYDTAYRKAKIKRVPLDMQKEDYEILQAAAAAAGEPVNAFIKRAIAERIEKMQKG